MWTFFICDIRLYSGHCKNAQKRFLLIIYSVFYFFTYSVFYSVFYFFKFKLFWHRVSNEHDALILQILYLLQRYDFKNNIVKHLSVNFYLTFFLKNFQHQVIDNLFKKSIQQNLIKM